MDRTEEDMKLVGFFGIFKQSFKTTFSSTKIFAQITLAFILPLSIILVVHTEIAQHVFKRINNNSLPYNTYDYSGEATAIEWLYYALFTFAYFLFLIVFSVLSTAAVVFTVASIYTGREVVFHNVMKVIPKVWKRLCITLVFIYIAIFIYDVLGSVAMAIPRVIFGYSGFGAVPFIIISILYAYGFLYLSVVCQLASVVTVLENIRGFKALRKGKDLAKGKKTVGMGLAVVLYGILVVLVLVCMLFVEYGHEVYKPALIWRVMIGILCGILFLVLLLLVIVTQTVFYLVCKSYHRKAIDKLSLSTFLGSCMGETVVYPGPREEIQLGCPELSAEQV